MHMSKLINISNNLYDRLKAMKGDESFTIVIENLVEKKTKSNKEAILNCAGKSSFNDKRLKELKKGWGKWNEKYA